MFDKMRALRLRSLNVMVHYSTKFEGEVPSRITHSPIYLPFKELLQGKMVFFKNKKL